MFHSQCDVNVITSKRKLTLKKLNVTLVCVLMLGVPAAIRLAGASAPKVTCDTCPVSGIDPKASTPFAKADTSQGCKTRTKLGFPVPDPKCTPGAINPTVTLEVLQNPSFKTGCIRDCATKETDKNVTYGFYSIPHPKVNTGENQVCELDHLVSLELGGADTLDNIWPQCGPASETDLNRRYFKQKDLVENYLAARVKSGKMKLADVQKGIATDWTQYLQQAKKFCVGNPITCGIAKPAQPGL